MSKSVIPPISGRDNALSSQPRERTYSNKNALRSQISNADFPRPTAEYIQSWTITDSNLNTRLQEVEYATKRLASLDILTQIVNAKDYVMDFALISAACMSEEKVANKDHRSQALAAALRGSLSKLLKDYWAALIKVCGETQNSEKIADVIWQKSIDRFPYVDPALDNFKTILYIYWNGSDIRRSEFGHTIYNELYEFILKLLDSPYIYPMNEERGSVPYDIVVAAVSIIHNFCHNLPDRRPELRDKKALKTVLKFCYFDSDEMAELKVIALLAASYLLSDDDKAEFEVDPSYIQYIVDRLRECIDQTDGKCSSGFDIAELIAGLNNIGLIDKNKLTLIDCGILQCYIEVMKNENPDLQKLAIKAVWTLSFKEESKQIIVNDENLMKEIVSLSKSSNTDVASAAKDVLWQVKPRASQSSASLAQTNRSQHIMISYNWEVQKEVLDFKERLKGFGFKVWIDKDNMRGDAIDAMVDAVQNAYIIIPILTEGYKNSNNCRREFDYATSLKKKIVPVIVATKYRPDGWIKFMLGSTYFYNLLREGEYEKLVNQLRQMPEEVDGRAGEAESIIPETAPIYGQSSISQPVRQLSHEIGKLECQGWTTDDVSKWSRENSLSYFDHILQKMDGTLLCELVHLQAESPEAYHKLLQTQDKNLLISTLQLNHALRKLRRV